MTQNGRTKDSRLALRLTWIILCFSLWTPGFAQTIDFDRSVLVLTGASSIEDLDEEVMEKYCSLASHPIRLNIAGETRMVDSGLFSRYQAASLMDYRKRNGDIMSVMELALLDGFDENYARALSQFVSFETSGSLAGTSGAPVELEVLNRISAKRQNDSEEWAYASKIRAGDSERWTLGIAAKSGYTDEKWPPEALSGSVALYGRGGRWSIVAGDFNTRFGQGLLKWSGFSLSGVQSAASFARHPSGISPAWTLSPSSAGRGVAGNVRAGRVVLSAYCCHDFSCGTNMTVLVRYGQLGLSAVSSGRSSVDWRWSFGKLDFFGELADDFRSNAYAALTGITYNPDYQVKMSALVRCYSPSYDGSGAGAFRSSTKSSDEHGAALALDYKKLVLTSDMAFHPSNGKSQHKAVLKYSPQISEHCELGFRLTSRFRPEDTRSWRNEFRAEMTCSRPSGFLLRGCGDICKCSDVSMLSFFEAGYNLEHGAKALSAFVRTTFFKVDRWDDRLYIYERDVQGAFSVPAYYGRGWSASAVLTCKWRGRAALNLRISALEYPWMAEKKPGKAELKVQLLLWNLKFHSRSDVG